MDYWEDIDIREITEEELADWARSFSINDVVQLAPFEGRTYHCLGCLARLGGKPDMTRGIRGIPCAHHELYRGVGKHRVSYPVFPTLSQGQVSEPVSATSEKLYAAYVKARDEYWAVFDHLVRDHYGITDAELRSHTDYERAVAGRDKAYNNWLAAVNAGKEV